MKCIATCASGLETFVAQELREQQALSIRPLTGQVSFTCDLETLYRICLTSRCASRIIVELAHIDATNADTLYQHIYDMTWEEIIDPHCELTVEAHGTNAALKNTHFSALRTKDAISDRFWKTCGIRPQTASKQRTSNTKRAYVSVRIHNNKAQIGLNVVGDPLFMRRVNHDHDDFLRPDFASAIAYTAYDQLVANSQENHDAYHVIFTHTCTTSCIQEMLYLLYRIYPNIQKATWGFSAWKSHDTALFEKLRAQYSENTAQTAQDLTLYAENETLSHVTHMARAMGIVPQVCQLYTQRAHNSLQHAQNSVAIALQDMQANVVEQTISTYELTHEMTRLKKDVPIIYLKAAEQTLSDSLSLYEKDTHALRTAQGQAEICCVHIQPQEKNNVQFADIFGNSICYDAQLTSSQQFASRLSKKYKDTKKWAQNELVSSWRIYDADLPDYAFAIDIWHVANRAGKAHRIPDDIFSQKENHASTSGCWITLSEYTPKAKIDEIKAQKRLQDAIMICKQMFCIPASHIIVKRRKRAKGGSQYTKQENRTPTKRFCEENGLVFELDFTSYLDTGLFLDHRPVREMIREQAKQLKGSKRFLNLFAYTATASCYAADGGAYHTTTVDLSKTYLEWAKRNMKYNGFTGSDHEFIQADVLRWVSEQRHTKNRWDLIFCDPPTFSNSSRMRKKSFDVQRDHVEMLIDISRLLTRNGHAIFSCNLRNFKPDIESLAKAGVKLEDISEKTIPYDFKRRKNIHHCYMLYRV